MNIICGVDISKARLDVCIEPGTIRGQFANTLEGAEALVAFCTAHKVELVAMEATGGYERLAYRQLWCLGQPCVLLNPRQVRRYGEALGFLEKTDAIDARLIAGFAQTTRCGPGTPPDEKQQRLEALVVRLRQLTDDMSLQKMRKEKADPDFWPDYDEVMALLRRQMRKLEGEIGGLIDDDPLWSSLNETFRSVKGVSDRTVATLMAHLPEIGTLCGRAIAKLAGLAPLAKDSGKKTGKRSIQGGRSSVRRILFLVGDIARRYHAGLGAFRERLLQKGKPKMVIRIALAHKLLTILNAKARDAREKLTLAT